MPKVSGKPIIIIIIMIVHNAKVAIMEMPVLSHKVMV